MGIELVLALLASGISLGLGGLVPLLEKTAGPAAQTYYNKNPKSPLSQFLKLIFKLDEGGEKSYQEKISSSLNTLKKATAEIDEVITEVSKISKEKQLTIAKLEDELKNLSTRESELKEKIETMEQVPVEALKHFEEILNRGNKRSAKRDYLLFAAGVLLTTIVSLVLFFLT